MKKIKVYIAGPYSTGDVGQNVHAAMRTWELLVECGYIPYCPHWTHFQHLLYPRVKEDWLALDMLWLEVCDIVLRLEGPSTGADAEVMHASMLHIPVVHTIKELQEKYPA